MIRTDRDGYVCALAMCGKAVSAAAPAARCRNRRRGSFMGPLSDHLPLAERDVMKCQPMAPAQSGLMFANLTTLPHFPVSSAMSLPKPAGEPGITVPPRSASCALNLGSARAALISRFKVLTISAGVFLGAPKPKKALAS